jgi:hypothetical protein
MPTDKYRADDNGSIDFTSKRPDPESLLRVKWWGVLLVFFGIYAYFFLAIYNINTRVTILETESKYVSDSVKELKSIAKENNVLAKESNMLIKQHLDAHREKR